MQQHIVLVVLALAALQVRMQVGLQSRLQAVLQLLQLLLVGLLVGICGVPHQLLEEDLRHLISARCGHVVALLGGVRTHLYSSRTISGGGF